LILSAVSSIHTFILLPFLINDTGYFILPVSQALARAGRPFEHLTF
jgi:hypothetical protein